jgi:hypothetical protein
MLPCGMAFHSNRRQCATPRPTLTLRLLHRVRLAAGEEDVGCQVLLLVGELVDDWASQPAKDARQSVTAGSWLCTAPTESNEKSAATTGLQEMRTGSIKQMPVTPLLRGWDFIIGALDGDLSRGGAGLQQVAAAAAADWSSATYQPWSGATVSLSVLHTDLRRFGQAKPGRCATPGAMGSHLPTKAKVRVKAGETTVEWIVIKNVLNIAEQRRGSRRPPVPAAAAHRDCVCYIGSAKQLKRGRVDCQFNREMLPPSCWRQHRRRPNT